MKRLGLCLFLFSVSVLAAFQYADYLAALCIRESGCNAGSINQAGFLGSFQMGEAALVDAGYYYKDSTPGKNDWQGTWAGKNGINSKADFLESLDKQRQAINDYNQVQWRYIMADGSAKFIGQTINGLIMTESGLLAGAHLVGHAALYKFLASNGRVLPQDGNQVAVTQYIGKFNGYDIAEITGHASTEGLGNVAGELNQGSADFTSLAWVTALSSPKAAFESSAGISYLELNGVIQMLIAMLLFLWSAYVSWGQFKLWSEGQVSFYQLQGNILKALVLMSVLLTVVLT